MKTILTNIRNFKLGEDLGLNLFYQDKGIFKVLRGEHTFTPGTNGKINRYLVRQQNRLVKLAKTDRKRFWKLACHLVMCSKSLRLVALRNVRPNWYKDTSFHKVASWLIELNGICYRPRETFEINRVSIPKDDGSLRWINDPGVA